MVLTNQELQTLHNLGNEAAEADATRAELWAEVRRLQAKVDGLTPVPAPVECVVCKTTWGLRKEGWYGYRCGSTECKVF